MGLILRVHVPAMLMSALLITTLFSNETVSYHHTHDTETPCMSLFLSHLGVGMRTL
jgi:hypothetical protein